MGPKLPWVLSGLLAIALAVAAVFAIWPAVGDAPWEAQSVMEPTATPIAPTTAPSATPQPKYTKEEVIGIVKGSRNRLTASQPYASNAGEEADWLCGQQAGAILGSDYWGYAEFQARYEGGGRWLVGATCVSVPQAGGLPSPLTSNGAALSAGSWSFLEDGHEVIPR